MLALKDPVSLLPSITTMIVSHKSFAQPIKEVFESYWEKSIPSEDFIEKNLIKGGKYIHEI